MIGGDYQGLGIVRSLGRQGVPVCVVDDELSISRYSRYATKFVKLANLHDERVVVDSLLELGKRLDLEGWVLYPTREELVAALSRRRSELSRGIPSSHTRVGECEMGLGQTQHLPPGERTGHSSAGDALSSEC